MFAVPQFASLETDSDPMSPAYQMVRELVPDWLSDKVASDILYTITCWRKANLGDALVIHIPLNWVPIHDRPAYRTAKLFGRPLILNEYVIVPQVAAVIREKPKP